MEILAKNLSNFNQETDISVCYIRKVVDDFDALLIPTVIINYTRNY